MRETNTYKLTKQEVLRASRIMENLLNKCKKEIERLEHIETDSTATGWLEARWDMLEEFIQWIEEEQNK